MALQGPVLAQEVESLRKRVASVRGVREVEDHLQVHEQAGDIPGLQGQPARRLSGRRLDVMQTYWSPTTRLLAGATGGALAVYGAGRRSTGGATLSLIGLTLLARALTNIEMKRLFGVRAGRRAIDIQKTINLNAPVERVFSLWADYKNFPYFMSNVREVKDLGDGRSHWIVAGPAGVPIEWEATISSYVPNEVLAWRTEPGSLIQHAGRAPKAHRFLQVLSWLVSEGFLSGSIPTPQKSPAAQAAHALPTILTNTLNLFSHRGI